MSGRAGSEAALHFALEPVESLTITTLMDNVADALLADQGPARRLSPGQGATGQRPAALVEGGAGPEMLRAEHGFSALVTVQKRGRTHQLLFDTGTTPDGMVENMRRLQLPPQEVEAVVMSHGHFDHTLGLEGFVDAVGRPNLPVILHPDFWNRRRMVVPGREPRDLPTTSKSALRGAGFMIVEERQPSFLFERSLLITGEVDRTTAFEQGLPVQQAFEDGHWQPDPLTRDDQALIALVEGKGLVVLTGCGHSGIVNILRYARRLTGVEQIYAVVGGFHLSGPLFEGIIGDTCAALLELSPSVVVPAHCTGWRAVHLLAATMPDAFIQNSVGTKLLL